MTTSQCVLLFVDVSLSSAERAPYLLLMELASSETSDSSFAELFDPLFAQWSQDHPDSADSRESSR